MAKKREDPPKKNVNKVTAKTAGEDKTQVSVKHKTDESKPKVEVKKSGASKTNAGVAKSGASKPTGAAKNSASKPNTQAAKSGASKPNTGAAKNSASKPKAESAKSGTSKPNTGAAKTNPGASNPGASKPKAESAKNGVSQPKTESGKNSGTDTKTKIKHGLGEASNTGPAEEQSDGFTYYDDFSDIGQTEGGILSDEKTDMVFFDDVSDDIETGAGLIETYADDDDDIYYALDEDVPDKGSGIGGGDEEKPAQKDNGSGHTSAGNTSKDRKPAEHTPAEHTPAEHTPAEHTPAGHTPVGRAADKNARENDSAGKKRTEKNEPKTVPVKNNDRKTDSASSPKKQTGGRKTDSEKKEKYKLPKVRKTKKAGGNAYIFILLLSFVLICVVLPRLSMFNHHIDLSEMDITAGEEHFLRMGDEGYDVAHLQRELYKLGYIGLDDINSRFDDTTLNALNTFLQERGMPVGTECSYNSFQAVVTGTEGDASSENTGAEDGSGQPDASDSAAAVPDGTDGSVTADDNMTSASATSASESAAGTDNAPTASQTTTATTTTSTTATTATATTTAAATTETADPNAVTRVRIRYAGTHLYADHDVKSTVYYIMYDTEKGYRLLDRYTDANGKEWYKIRYFVDLDGWIEADMSKIVQ